MIYLIRHSINEYGEERDEIACCEAADCAERYEAEGFTRCYREIYIAAWRAKDLRRMDMLGLILLNWAEEQTETETAPLKPGTIITRLANGVTLYTTRGRP